MTAIHLDELAAPMTAACGHIMRLYVKLYATGRPIQPSLDFTAKQYGLNEKTVRRANEALVAAGFLTVQKVRTPGRPWSHNVYHLAGDLLAAAKERLRRIAAATARTVKEAGAEAIRLHRRLWHRKKPGIRTPDILPDNLSSFFPKEKKKETSTPKPPKPAWLQQFEAGQIKADLELFEKQHQRGVLK